MLLHTECFNPYHTNCYFLTDEESGSTVIIDPGCYFRRERTRVQHLIRLPAGTDPGTAPHPSERLAHRTDIGYAPSH